MQLRPHETNQKLTVATYENDEEADTVANGVAGFLRKIPVYSGLTDGVDISKDGSLTRLDNGEIELTHRTKRLARFADRIARDSVRNLGYSLEKVYPWYKGRQAVGDTINQYLSDRIKTIPTYEPPIKKEPTSEELARTAAYEKVKKPLGKTFTVSSLGALAGLSSAGAGRFVEAFSVNSNMQGHVNEALRQVGNDISYAGLGAFAVGLAVGLGITVSRMRSEDAFNDGWNEAASRLDPDGQIEAALLENQPQAQAPEQ